MPCVRAAIYKSYFSLERKRNGPYKHVLRNARMWSLEKSISDLSALIFKQARFPNTQTASQTIYNELFAQF